MTSLGNFVLIPCTSTFILPFRLQREARLRDASTQTDEETPQRPLTSIGRGATPLVSGTTSPLPRGRGRCLAACKAASEAFRRVMDA